jgi:uncharacterized protein Usg
MMRAQERLPILSDRYRLATAEILYRMPDHPALLQTFVWQDYDLAPQFPALAKFLAFWQANLDGKLYSVRVTSTLLVGPGRYRPIAETFTLH